MRKRLLERNFEFFVYFGNYGRFKIAKIPMLYNGDIGDMCYSILMLTGLLLQNYRQYQVELSCGGSMDEGLISDQS